METTTSSSAAAVGTQPQQTPPTSSPSTTLQPHNNSNNNDSKEGERPVWSSRLAYAGALLSLQLSHFWRGAGVVGGPHNYNVWTSMVCMLLCLAAIGAPLLLLEVGVGQTYSLGGIGMWQLPPYCQWQYHRSSGGGGGKGKRPWTGLGVAGMVVGFSVASYSVGILAWACHALMDIDDSSQSLLGGDEMQSTILVGNNTDVTEEFTTNNTTASMVANASNPEQPQYYTPPHLSFRDYFVREIVGQSTLDFDDLSPTRLVGENVLFAGLIWLLVFTFSSLGSIRLVGRTSLVLTSTSLVLLATLCVGSLTIPAPPASFTGETTISDSHDFTAAIGNGDVLSQSMIQTLYITGILMGVLSSYASYAPSTKEPTAKIAACVMVLNAGVIFITGYAMSRAFVSASSTTEYLYVQSTSNTNSSTAYNNSNNNHQETPPMIVDSLSTTLFVVLVQWPAALAVLPNGIAWVRLLYSVFILLGIQFPMAIVTAIVTVIREDRTSGIARYVQVTLCPRLLWSAEMRSKNRRPSLLLCILLFNRTYLSYPMLSPGRTYRWKITGLASSLGFVTSLLFATDAGLIFLDTIDYCKSPQKW